MIEPEIVLSICIATRNRAAVIGTTLDALLAQCPAAVEVVVVDGASTDSTAEVVGARARRWPALRYFPQQSNSGVDGDFDKAVVLARGEYCWLLSDDDLPLEGALERILAACGEHPAALIADAEVCSDDLSTRLMSSRIPFAEPRRYGSGELDRLLADCGDTLSFIGALVIRRELWLQRDRASYYGSEFVHVGVVFQAPLPGPVVALPGAVLRIRYGVGNWVWRSFEVWMFKWPRLIWSFGHIAPSARSRVTPRCPWHNPVTLLLYRAKGWYSWGRFRVLVVPAQRPWMEKIFPALVALVPGQLALMLVWLAISLRPGHYLGSRGDLHKSPYAPGRWLSWLRPGKEAL